MGLKKQTIKQGGKRKGAGRKSPFTEATKTVSFRCPLSKVDELKLIVKSKLSEWSVKQQLKQKYTQLKLKNDNSNRKQRI